MLFTPQAYDALTRAAGKRAEDVMSANVAESSGPQRSDAVRMAAQALSLLHAGHDEAAIGVYRAMAMRYPAMAELCAVQIKAVDLFRAGAQG